MIIEKQILEALENAQNALKRAIEGKPIGREQKESHDEICRILSERQEEDFDNYD